MKRQIAPKRRGHLTEVRTLAMAELRRARAHDQHITFGIAQVPEDKMWEWFLKKLSAFETEMIRQSQKGS